MLNDPIEVFLTTMRKHPIFFTSKVPMLIVAEEIAKYFRFTCHTRWRRLRLAAWSWTKSLCRVDAFERGVPDVLCFGKKETDRGDLAILESSSACSRFSRSMPFPILATLPAYVSFAFLSRLRDGPVTVRTPSRCNVDARLALSAGVGKLA